MSNFPLGFNVNLANPSTPPTTQNVNVTSTPVVSILNTNVGVNNWPTTFPTQGIVNVNVANQSTPPSTQTVQGTVTANVTFPGIQNVNLANVSTPPTTQNVNIVNAATPLLVDNPIGQTIDVSIASTPVVSILNTNVGVNNWPTTYQTQGIVNVNLANVATPPLTQNVKIVDAATPLLVDNPIGQTLDVRETATPITYSYQPYPYSVQGTVNVGNLPGVQNVNLANQSTPPLVQNVSVTSTPVVYAQVVSMPITYPVTSEGLFVAAGSATPVVLAAGRAIVVKSYVLTTSAVSTVGFQATPSLQLLLTPKQAGIQQTLKDSATVGGPYFMSANSSISFAGDVDGHGLSVSAATPLWLVAAGGNVGGHITYVLV